MSINTANQMSDVLQYPMNKYIYYVLLMCEYHIATSFLCNKHLLNLSYIVVLCSN